MKKVTNTKKKKAEKKAEKEDKVCEKTQSRNLSLNIKRFVLNNNYREEVNTFRDISSNLNDETAGYTNKPIGKSTSKLIIPIVAFWEVL